MNKFNVGDAVMFTSLADSSQSRIVTVSAIYYADEQFKGRRESDGSAYVGYVYGVSGSKDIIIESSLSMIGQE